MNQYKSPVTNDIDQMMESFQKFMSDLAENRNERQNELNQRLNEDCQNRLNLQEKVAFGLARISPASIFSLTASNIASTSIKLKQRYLQSAIDYQRVYSTFLREKLDGALPEAGMVMRKIGDEDSEPINSAELPVYNYPDSSISEVIQASVFDFAILIILTMAFFTCSVFVFYKFDVR